MSKRKFIPDNELEEAILNKDNTTIIRLIAERRTLDRPDILAEKAFSALPLRTEAVVLRCGMSYSLRHDAVAFLKQNHPDSPIPMLIFKVEDFPHCKPTADDDLLLQFITTGNVREIRHMIGRKHCSLQCADPKRLAVFCRSLLRLNPYTAFLLLAEGFQDTSIPSLLTFLLKECEKAYHLNDVEYRKRLMLANLLIHILQGEITPEDDDLIYEDWYPMGNSIKDGCDQSVYCHSYSYYFDPQHLYEPRYTDGEYEKPEHNIR